ncbi:stage II sporulation protein P [Marinicrinis lubricantis]|uniref:Stage II sporulation protein P n=1 Tax=Marinicrinis lubricantis TaxID=2086470 RepID=A0ABW1IV09_9BACL
MKAIHSFRLGSAPLFVKLFTALSCCTLILFVILSIGGIIQAKRVTSPISSMKGLTATVSSNFFLDMIALEMPRLKSDEENTTFSKTKVGHFLFEFVTNINPSDPKTLLAREVPGMAHEKIVVLRKGSHDGAVALPADYTPSKEVLESPPRQQTNPEPPKDDPNATPSVPNDTVPDPEPDTTEPPKNTTNGKSKVFIYHSHNRESWVPELEGVTELDQAYDSSINITLVGKRMADRLQELGIGTTHSATDYQTKEQDFNYNYSYKYSKKTVQEAFATNPELDYFLDVHRDSQTRDLTTVNINGVDYAQLYFIIGLKNPNWKQNEEFANEILKRLDEKYPGISRGIYAKDGTTGNGEYNQSISPRSLVVEIGGPENTLEETNRTADVLAEVLAEIFWEAEKVDAPASSGQQVVTK